MYGRNSGRSALSVTRSTDYKWGQIYFRPRQTLGQEDENLDTHLSSEGKRGRYPFIGEHPLVAAGQLARFSSSRTTRRSTASNGSRFCAM
jgi:hypothetical protein